MISIFKQYPSLKEKIPYITLGEFPTPLMHLAQLGKEIGADRLYLKNDGLSGSIYGGNKIRKLEFLLGDALNKGAKAVLTFGFAGSNHALATAVYAQSLGLKCISILLAQPNAQYVRHNLLFSKVYQSEICHFNKEMAAYIPTFIKFFRNKLKHGKFPYIIDPGGSSPLGTIGYVNAVFELKEQYARFTKQGMAAVDLVAKSEGIKLEGTYTGKAMAAIINQYKDRGEKNEVILFWNTYNGRNFLDKIKEIDFHLLPQPFHFYFEEDIQPLEKHRFNR